MLEIKTKLRIIPNHPRPGVTFIDITPLLEDKNYFSAVIDEMAKNYEGLTIDKIVGIDARGFVFAAALAYKLKTGLVLIRKNGKLPAQKIVEEYKLEYRTDVIEMHEDSILPGEKVMIVDDVWATGGTIKAAMNLVLRRQAEIVGISFVINLKYITGRQNIFEYPIYYLAQYDEDPAKLPHDLVKPPAMEPMLANQDQTVKSELDLAKTYYNQVKISEPVKPVDTPVETIPAANLNNNISLKTTNQPVIPPSIETADIGVIGGSGFYSLLENARQIELMTEYGQPSSPISIAEIDGKKIAFISRHGKKHELSPHQVPYRANISAFKQLGVKKIIAASACGSLQTRIKPGDFVILDQFIDRTKARGIDTFFDGEKTVHVTAAEPYCGQLRQLAVNACQDLGIFAHEKGTIVVIEGPRFSSRAESRWYSSTGFDVINMTQYPEVILAREAEICYSGLALVTDYDAGLIGSDGLNEPVTIEDILEIFKQNNEEVKKVIILMIKKMEANEDCPCRHALDHAAVN